MARSRQALQRPEPAPKAPPTFTPEELDRIGELGKLQFTPEEAAVILEYPALPELIARRLEHPVGRAWIAGRLIAERDVRRTTYDHATKGDAKARAAWSQITEDTRRREARGDA